jgi:hypothetical protein
MTSSTERMKLPCALPALHEYSDRVFQFFDKSDRYSLHVLGLLFDGRERTVFLCDPNGCLLPGGNM